MDRFGDRPPADLLRGGVQARASGRTRFLAGKPPWLRR
jgi:hypothetical protein